MKFFKILFALLCYLLGFAVIIYYIDFFTGYFVPKDINTGNPTSFLNALLVDTGLILLFGLQHTIMARTGFKAWFEQRLPSDITRSVYILLTSIVLGLLIWFWQPIPLVIFDLSCTITGNILLGLYFLGWAIGLLSSFEIDHFKLFGVKQAIYPNEKEDEELKKPFFYRVVRHPIYLGWILIHWMTPVMTIGHLLLAVGITIYIYLALIYEERDLVAHFGQQYLDYKKETPAINPLFYPFKKSAAGMRILKVLALLSVVMGLGYAAYFANWVSNEIALKNSDDPSIWEDEIHRITELNPISEFSEDEVLFVGSSSFRFWDQINEDLHPLEITNLGFGGAKISDVQHFAKELIYSYQPEKLVFFLGSNDISGNTKDISPNELFSQHSQLLQSIHEQLPKCQISILPITPTLARWSVWPEIREANELINNFTRQHSWLTFIELEKSFLTDTGDPDWKYYKWDGIHLSKAGYAIWSNSILQTFNIQMGDTKAMNGTSKQRTMEYTQSIKGSPAEIFPLLCPNRETDWLDGWKYDMIYSESGFAEANAVFKTPMHGKEDTYWMVSRYEPDNHIIEFVRFTFPEVIVKISIEVHESEGDHTPVDIAYTYTALTEDQNTYIEEKLPTDFEESMIWWEKSMNHYLSTGEMLLHES